MVPMTCRVNIGLPWASSLRRLGMPVRGSGANVGLEELVHVEQQPRRLRCPGAQCRAGHGQQPFAPSQQGSVAVCRAISRQAQHVCRRHLYSRNAGVSRVGLEPHPLCAGSACPRPARFQRGADGAVVGVVSGELVVLTVQQVRPCEVAPDLPIGLEAPLDDGKVVRMRHIAAQQAAPGLIVGADVNPPLFAGEVADLCSGMDL